MSVFRSTQKKRGRPPLGPAGPCAKCGNTKNVRRNRSIGLVLCEACYRWQQTGREGLRPGKRGQKQTWDIALAIALYDAGATMKQIEKEIGKSRFTIWRAMKSIGRGKPRGQVGGQRMQDNAAQRFAKLKDEILPRYRAGEGRTKLASEYRFGGSVFRRLLEVNGEKIRTVAEQNALSRALSANEQQVRAYQDATIVARYKAGESANELGYEFKLSGKGIRKILEAGGAKIRSKSEAIKLAVGRRKISNNI